MPFQNVQCLGDNKTKACIKKILQISLKITELRKFEIKNNALIIDLSGRGL
jgi:hypothetical protein